MDILNQIGGSKETSSYPLKLNQGDLSASMLIDDVRREPENKDHHRMWSLEATKNLSSGLVMRGQLLINADR